MVLTISPLQIITMMSCGYIRTFLSIVTLVLGNHTSSAQLTVDTIALGNNPHTGKYAELRHFKMYYEVYGKGAPLLFIHGNGGSIKDFKYQIPYFAKHFKVIVADSRAHGKSSDSSDSLSFDMMADDFAALLDQLKIDSCHVVGWSDGAINSLLLAIRHPHKVKKLVVSGANLWADTTALDAWFCKQMVLWHAELGAPTSLKGKNDKKLLELMMYQPPIELSTLQKIKCPALVIGGDHDVIKPAHTLMIASAITRSYVWLLPKAGHSTHMTYRTYFNPIVLDFLTKPYRSIEGKQRFD